MFPEGKRYIDWDSPEEQEAAIDLALMKAIEKRPRLKGAHAEKDEHGVVFAVKGKKHVPLGHISNCLTSLEQ